MKIIRKPNRDVTSLATYIGCQFRCTLCGTEVALENTDIDDGMPSCEFVEWDKRTLPEWLFQCPVCRFVRIKVGDMHVLHGGDGLPLREGAD